MDKYLISGSIFLLLSQFLLLLVDLGALPDYFDLSSSNVQVGDPIGSMNSVRQNVKRRSQGAIIWEQGHSQQKLYYYDSILTLKESSTDLVIKDDIHLHLHENTLVVVEPPDVKSDDTLKFRFSRGDLRAKSGRRDVSIHANSWTVSAPKNSIFSLRQISDGKMEVEVSQGTLTLTKPNETSKESATRKVLPGQRIIYNQTSVSKTMQIDKALTWTNLKNIRRYSHSFPTNVSLSWTGKASHIRLRSRKGLEQIFKLNKGQRGIELTLARGQYTAYLEYNNNSSPSKIVEIWKAPVIQYFSPLPRNRVKTSDLQSFSWSPLKEAAKYRLDIIAPDQPLKQKVSQSTSERSVDYSLVNSGLHYWKIYAIDKDGFEIPPSYFYPLYSVDTPLPAPRLRAPSSSPKTEKNEVIKDGTKKSIDEQVQRKSSPNLWSRNIARAMFSYIFPTAHAAAIQKSDNPNSKILTENSEKKPLEQRELIFNWYPVDGANFYVIEVSSSRNFRNPEVIKKIVATNFVWSGFENKIYYWRVAAGKSTNILGLFSEPAKINLSTIQPGELAPGVLYKITKITPPPKKIAKTVSIKAKKPPITPKPKPNPQPQLKKFVEPPKQLPAKYLELRGGLNYRVVNHYLSQSTNTGISASLSGVAPTSASLWVSFPGKKSNLWIIQGSYTQLSWIPESTKTLPFQSELESPFFDISILNNSIESDWAWGLTGWSESTISRIDNESVELKSWQSYGVIAQYEWSTNPDWYARHSVSLSFGDGIRHYASGNNFSYTIHRFNHFGLAIGGLINLQIFESSDGPKGVHIETGMQMGIDF